MLYNFPLEPTKSAKKCLLDRNLRPKDLLVLKVLLSSRCFSNKYFERNVNLISHTVKMMIELHIIGTQKAIYKGNNSMWCIQ